MSWTATEQIVSSQASLICVSGIRFRFFGASAPRWPPFTDQDRLEGGSPENLAALNGVAGLTGVGRHFPGAFGNGARGNTGTKSAAVPERIHLDAEYRANGECGRCNALAAAPAISRSEERRV